MKLKEVYEYWEKRKSEAELFERIYAWRKALIEGGFEKMECDRVKVENNTEEAIG